MAFVVDTAVMEPERAPEYLRLIESEVVPVMTGAGAGFVSCWSTSAELGEDVSVKTIWSFTDHVEWNVIRKNMVLDPRYYAYSEKLAQLRTGGTRRFFYPSSFSPLH
jgi:NIPSNAP